MSTNFRDIAAHGPHIAGSTSSDYVAFMSDHALVHIIDDDLGVRKGLSSLIRSCGHDVQVYESTKEFLQNELPDRASCLLLDVRMPGSNGLDFQVALQKRGIFIPVILMTGFGDIQMSVQGMKAGAIDFLTKPLRHQDVLTAVDAAIRRDSERRKDHAEVSAVRIRYATLTPREIEVFSLVSKGLMNKQMAGQMELSEITVKLHRGSMMRKMGVRTVADLVKLAEVLRRAENSPSERL